MFVSSLSYPVTPIHDGVELDDALVSEVMIVP